MRNEKKIGKRRLNLINSIFLLVVVIIGSLIYVAYIKPNTSDLTGYAVAINPSSFTNESEVSEEKTYELSDDSLRVIGTSSLDRAELYENAIVQSYGQEQKSKGYIIKLKEKPIALVSDQKTQKEKIRNEHAATKEKIKQKLGKEPKIMDEYDIVFNGIALDINEDEAKKIKEIDGIEEIYPNLEVHTTLMDSAPLIGATQVWDSGYTGRGIKIAIIDTGVDYTHPDLGSCTQTQFLNKQCTKVVDGYDFYNRDNNPMDDHGHGTHVAATAAGNGALKGIAPDAIIYAYKVLSASGSGTFSQVISGINRAVDPNNDGNTADHVDIISMSLGGTCSRYSSSCGPDDAASQAVDNAVTAGVINVIAAGNSGPNPKTISTPGTARKAITIAASYKKNYNGTTSWGDVNPRVDQITRFSSRGPIPLINETVIKPDVASPGAFICAAQYDNAWSSTKCFDDKHVAISGTSMATPHVAGAAALIKQAHPDWSPEDIKRALKNSAKDIGYNLTTQGYGRINVLKAVQLQQKPLVSQINILGIVNGISKNIKGSAYGDGFSGYSLYYANNEKSNYNLICSSTTPVTNSVLCNWNLESVLDGTYLLKLVVSRATDQSIDYLYVTVSNNKITSPKDLISDYTRYEESEVWPTWKNITIYGYTLDSGFDYYNISLCQVGNCIANAIILENGGKLPVTNGKLGIIDTSKVISNGFYNLTLKTYYLSGFVRSSTNLIYLEPRIHKNWPIGSVNLYWTPDQPIISDIDNNGKEDIIVMNSGYLKALDSEASNLKGFPVLASSSSDFTAPAVEDINYDGNKEIIITNNQGNLIIYNNLGTKIFSKKIDPLGFSLNAPVVADINNDGKIEIITSRTIVWNSSTPLSIYVTDISGNYLPGWPLDINNIANYSTQFIQYPLSIGDIDNDGNKEIGFVVVSSDYSSRCTRVYILSNNGLILNGWPKTMCGNTYLTSYYVAFADLDNDIKSEIIGASYDGKIYAWNGDGSNLAGFPVNTTGCRWHTGLLINRCNYLGAPAISDVDNDGNKEIFIQAGNVPGMASGSMSCVLGYKANGIRLSGFPVCASPPPNMSGFFVGQPIIGDIEGDSKKEIILASSGGFIVNGLVQHYAFHHNGSVVKGFPIFLNRAGGVDVDPVGDMDGDSKYELLIGDLIGKTYLFDFSGNVNSREWPMAQHDAQHTGCADCKVSSINITIPLAPTNLIAQALSTSSIKLQWTDNSNNEFRFKIERSIDGINFNEIGTTEADISTFTDTGLQANTIYYYKVRAYNSAGNSNYSNIINIATLEGDTTPPIITISSPINGTTIVRSVTISASAIDESGIANIKIYVDELVKKTCIGATSCAYKWNAAKASTGIHRIRVDALDKAGNSASESVYVIKGILGAIAGLFG